VSDIFPSPGSRNRFLILLALLLFLPFAPGRAQQTSGAISGTVVDARNQPVAGAQISDTAGQLLATTAADGSFTVPAGTSHVQIIAPHFEPTSTNLEGPSPVHVLLEHPLESVVVTAYRSPLASGDSPASTRILTTRHLRQAAGISLDDKLRQRSTTVY